MKVVMIGTGYVGLVSGTCFAEMGHNVTCVDVIPEKVEMLKAGKSPIYEPGLNELLERNISKKRLSFSTGYEDVAQAQCVFLAVGTPSTDEGNADLKYLLQASKDIAPHLNDEAIVVIKSTVPVGTCEKVKEVISTHTKKNFHVVNNPEFLKEGSAVDDFMRPDRVVIGYANEEAAEVMDELYSPLFRKGNRIFKMSNVSAEMSKYAANCFLATKISFINEIARLCDLTGADIEEVRAGITSDQRIGGHFLFPGAGYGGSCFPKDVKALIYTAKENDLDLKIVQAADDVNNEQKLIMFHKIKNHFKGDLSGKTISFWGVAFKPNTDDIREAPAIYMAQELVKAGAKVKFYDPVAATNYANYMKEIGVEVERVDNKYDCLNGSDAVCVVTEWAEFRSPDFNEMKDRLNSPLVFDARNIYRTSKALKYGMTYYAIGKHI